MRLVSDQRQPRGTRFHLVCGATQIPLSWDVVAERLCEVEVNIDVRIGLQSSRYRIVAHGVVLVTAKFIISMNVLDSWFVNAIQRELSLAWDVVVHIS